MKNVAVFGDLWILSKVFQKFSTWSQNTFGLTNFWWTRFFLKIGFIAMTINIIINFKVDAYAWIIFLQSVFWLFMLVFVLGIDKLCIKLEKRYTKGHKHVNKRIKTLFMSRVMYSVLSGWNFVLLLILIVKTRGLGENILPDIMVSTVPICLYFISCTPLPPSQSKLKVWLKNMKKKATKVLSPEVEPEPSPC